jgi:hypothetical protein
VSAPSTDSGIGDAGRRLVEEALRFVEALQDQAAGSGAGPGGDVPDAGPAHLGPECRVCPVCRLIAAVRAVRPEAVEHLAVAAAELAGAWREMVTPPGAPDAPPGAPAAPPVERIDVTD